MSDDASRIQDTPPEASKADAIDHSRRKLTGAVLGVSAVFTLASRPVLAQTCMTASAFATSGNLSPHGTPATCTGRTPAFWVGSTSSNNENNGFPGGNINFHLQTTNPVLNGVFKAGSRANWGNSTLRTVMDTGDNGNAAPSANPISKEFAATLLNIRDGYIPSSVLSEAKLIGMWNEWMDSGEFTPTAGVTPWKADAIVLYLRSLQSI